MKNLLYLIAMISCVPSLAQDWKEYKRTVKDKEIAFTDTMFIYSLDDKNASLRIGGFKYDTEVKEGVVGLVFGNFKVIKNDSVSIELEKNSEVRHYFKKRERVATAVPPVMTNELQRVAQMDATMLLGSWTAYKRVNKNGPTEGLDFNSLIKIAEFKQDANGDIVGELKLSGNAASNLYIVNKAADGVLEAQSPSGKMIQMEVYELSKRELIFEGEQGIIYYMRKVK